MKLFRATEHSENDKSHSSFDTPPFIVGNCFAQQQEKLERIEDYNGYTETKGHSGWMQTYIDHSIDKNEN